MSQQVENERDQSDLVTYAQAALLLGVPPSTLYSLVCRKQVPHVRLSRRLVRFSRAGLSAWVAEHAVAATASRTGPRVTAANKPGT